MLDLSKLESGEYQVNARMFNIWETITGVALSAEQRINDGMIDIDGLTMDEKVLVYADPDLIHQVVYNLLDNAIKFTPAGGTIRFRVEKLGPEAEISIWNSGQGISPEALPYVFQRFYKEDRSRGLHARGAGSPPASSGRRFMPPGFGATVGRVNTNRHHSPCWLSTRICPPDRLTSTLQMFRPRPAPRACRPRERSSL